MRREVLILALCLGCGCGAEPDADPAPVAQSDTETPAEAPEPVMSVVRLSPSPDIADWARRAAYRWNTATGCVDGSGCEFIVGQGGVPVEYVDSIPREGQGDAAGVSRPDGNGGWEFVHIASGTADPFRSLMHELGHLRGAEHTDTGVTASLGRKITRAEAVEIEYFAISAESLEAACVKTACLAFVPEE
jgi:hypothetical protein